jgi:hypothetical protein
VVTSQIAGEIATARAVMNADDLIDVWINSDMVAHPKPAADPVSAGAGTAGRKS